jgi:hypothetical protein
MATSTFLAAEHIGFAFFAGMPVKTSLAKDPKVVVV